MPSKHFKYGGSTAGRTLQCAGWRKLAATLPEKPMGPSPDADRGTLLHDCMEALLRDPDLKVTELLGREYSGQVITEAEIDEAIVPALDAYINFAEDHNITIEHPEMEVSISDEIGGTSDIIAANDDTVFIIDWKFGYNPVSATDNAQGMFYAMCAMVDDATKHLFEGRDKLCTVIIQPTTGHILDASFYTKERLHEFLVEHTAAVEVDAMDLDLKCTTGPYCKFCPAEAICPEKTGAVRAALMLDPDSATAQQLPDMLRMADELSDWILRVRALAHEQAEMGVRINGYKLVDKRASRKWIDEAEALDVFKKARKLKLEDVTDIKLKSPAQLEKVCKKKGVDFKKYAAYIESVSSGTTLVPEDDKRPEAFNMAGLINAINVTD